MDLNGIGLVVLFKSFIIQFRPEFLLGFLPKSVNLCSVLIQDLLFSLGYILLGVMCIDSMLTQEEPLKHTCVCVTVSIHEGYQDDLLRASNISLNIEVSHIVRLGHLSFVSLGVGILKVSAVVYVCSVHVWVVQHLLSRYVSVYRAEPTRVVDRIEQRLRHVRYLRSIAVTLALLDTLSLDRVQSELRFGDIYRDLR